MSQNHTSKDSQVFAICPYWMFVFRLVILFDQKESDVNGILLKIHFIQKMIFGSIYKLSTFFNILFKMLNLQNIPIKPLRQLKKIHPQDLHVSSVWCFFFLLFCMIPWSCNGGVVGDWCVGDLVVKGNVL